MKKTWAVLLTIVVGGCAKQEGQQSQADSATASTTVALTATTTKKTQLELPHAMRTALDQFAPSFEPFSPAEYSRDVVPDSTSWLTNTPYQAKGDFNGDGLPDLALNGHDSTRELLIVLLSQPDSTYRVYPLKDIGRQPTYNHDVILPLSAAPPGYELSAPPPHPERLPHGGIVVNYPPPTSAVFYWNGSSFVQFFGGD